MLHPAALHLCTFGQRVLGVGVLVVRVARMLTGHLAFDEERFVAAGIDRYLLLGEVQFDDARDGPGQELPVVADDHQRCASTADEVLELIEPVEVEVVGRFVEKEDVVAGQQQRRQADPGHLSTRQGGHRCVQVDRQAQLRGDLFGALVEVRPTQVQPAFERRRIQVVAAVRQCGGGLVHRRLRLRHPHPAAQEVPDRLPGDELGLLGQVADLGIRGTERDRAVEVGCALAGEQREERRLAGTVGADQPEHVALRNGQVQIGEQRPLTVTCGQSGGMQGGADGGDAPSRVLGCPQDIASTRRPDSAGRAVTNR